jgi:mono/diheme cytochrome c family protein
MSLFSLTLGCSGGAEDSGDAGPDGASLYTDKCATCHAEDGTGNAAILADVVPALSDTELDDVIRNGTDSGMASDLVTDDSEVDAIIDHLRDTWGG